MGKPHVLKPPAGPRGGSDSSAQTKPGRGICRPTLVSHAQQSDSRQVPVCGGRGTQAARAHIPLPSSHSPTPPTVHAHAGKASRCPLPPKSPPCAPRDPALWGRIPEPSQPPSMVLLPSPLPAPLGTSCPAKEEPRSEGLVSGGRWDLVLNGMSLL